MKCFYGQRKIKKEDLEKIANVLGVQMEFFEQNMDKEIKFYVSDRRKSIATQEKIMIDGIMQRFNERNK